MDDEEAALLQPSLLPLVGASRLAAWIGKQGNLPGEGKQGLVEGLLPRIESRGSIPGDPPAQAQQIRMLRVSLAQDFAPLLQWSG